MTFYAPRAALAQSIAARMTPDPLLGAEAGLFLAAPRRTGKSTFLRRDLVPCLRERGLFPIYVDLWSDRKADPGRLIAHALADVLDGLASAPVRLVRALPFRKVSVGGISVDLAAGEGTRAATLAEALTEIGRRAGKDLVVIVDEAQHALSSDAGLDAMFALKAARDAMNQREGAPRLYLLFTGSHRDKLAALVMTHRQPFYGATVSEFPRLGRDYVEALVAAINPRLATDNRLDPDDVESAFRVVGYRPEVLMRVIQDHALGEAGSAGLRQTVIQRADALRALAWAQHASDFDALTPTQRAVLETLIRDGTGFAPFAEDTVRRIAARAEEEVTTSDVQKALDALRDRSLVWRPARGIYALEDQDMRDWLLGRA